ncbi:MAG: RluA family pseudouridine synthase, partial [Treponemataceae bacterium]|nr:RluA family pseudouridine synthase [Treponemataceae bacterium]
MIYRFSCADGCRLDGLLRALLPEAAGEIAMSNAKIRRLVIAGAVRVDGAVCRRPAYRLGAGSRVSVSYEREKFFYERQPDDIPFEMTAERVLYEDDAVIVVDKPPFFPTETTVVGSGRRDSLHQAVVRWLWRQNPSLPNPPYAGIMHRLDRETSGAILFTKRRTANAAVHRMFAERLAEKSYRAVAVCSSRGAEPPPARFSVKDCVGRISPKSVAAKWGALSEQRGGLPAHTDFAVLGRSSVCGNLVFYMEARPRTGRTHQIRVHLSGAGLPILGDTLYGAPEFERMM